MEFEIIEILQLNPLIGEPKSNHGAYDDDILQLDLLREKLRLQIDKFREISYDRNVSFAKLVRVEFI